MRSSCYCKGIIMIVAGVLYLLESLQVIQLGIMPYWPVLFILMGLLCLLPDCLCGAGNGRRKD
ncbi:LiaI-LiaF-like domain-containing protein [Patescibacteria group bacterium]